MTTLLHSDSRCLYSWWWDSHISPKNSKWLQENLQDMDAKVKAMIKLIEEDADSFARRAEMYYQKRPELMKLVEELYRAYRALAERYDHATGELRQAHRTMAEAFPNQVQFVLPDGSSLGSSLQECGPHKPEMAHPIRALLDSDDFDRALTLIGKNGPFPGESNTGKKGLKQLHEIFGGGLEKEERVKTSNVEIQKLKKELDDMHSEKESVLLQYQKSVGKLSNLEEELNCAQTISRELGEEANKAAVEIQTLKEALVKLESERDAGFLKHKEFLERISNLEFMASQAQKDAQGCNERAVRAETEAKCLEKELSRSGTAKDARLLQYKQCLEKISDLERNLSVALEEARLLYHRAEKSETEVRELKKALSAINEDKKAAANRYEDCLDKISKLEAEISSSQEKRVLLETSNQSLRLEADNLTKKIAMKDEELSRKHEVLEKLQACVNTDQLRFVQVEATLQTLQYLHSQSQEEEKALALELKNGLQMLKDMEISKHGLEEENRVLSELNSSSAVSMGNLQGEMLRLREMKEKLEEELQLQMGQTSSLQQEIYHLKEDIHLLNKRHEDLLKQVELVGLNPECIGSSVKEVLFKKFDDMKKILDKNFVLECSVTNLSGELNGSREKVKVLQESCQWLNGEKSALVAEKAALLSHLQIIMENMQKLVEQNTLLENSLSVTNVELEGLREKSKGLEELCNLLNNDKSKLLNERGTLVVQLKNVEGRLENLEWRMAEMERKNVGLEKEKESMVSHVEELKVSLGVEKQERTSFAVSSGARLTCLENHVQLMHEETRQKRKEFEEVDKTVNAQFEIFVLQKFIEDMKQKNHSLKIECRKHIEASKFAETLISELESENLEQQVEVELLLDEIEKARMENCMLEEENDSNILDTFELDILSAVFKTSATEKAEELKLLCGVNGDVEKKIGVLRRELEIRETEKLLLKESVEKLEKELLEAIGKLKAIETLNSELCKTVDELKGQHENLEKHIVELSEEKLGLNKEIECLREANGHLESEVGISCEEIKEHRIREENLSSELLEISNEFEIWESQATTFYFDLQISNVHKVLFENKVYELTKVCETLENENASKTVQIEKMIERTGLMEIEIGELRTQLLAYAPVIESLRDNVASLEDNILSPPELDVAENLEPKDVDLAVHLHEEIHQELIEDNKSMILKGIPELQKLQTRIKAFEKVLVEKMKVLTTQKSLNTSIELESSAKEIEELSSEEIDLRNELNSKLKLLKIRPEITKDIPLDRVSNASFGHQMLELWETVEPKTFKKSAKELGVDKLAVPTNFNEPNQVRNKRKILERLDSDAQKLNTLQITVEELSRKLERNKSVDLGTVKEQLLEVEETILHLLDVNNQLTRKIEVGPLQSDGKAFSPEMEAAGIYQRKRVAEQARKGSEKLERLQLEVQKIQYVVLKLQDEKKSKGKLRFARSRTGVILKNFIYNAGRSSPRRKKGCLRGCFRPSSHGDGSSINVFN